MMLITILAITLFTALGITHSRYELIRAKRQRCEQLRQRARRCVKSIYMEQTNAIGSVKVGNITLNLHNVGYLETIDLIDDDDKPVKVSCGCIISAVGTRYFIRAI